jgi:hypothetical protein
MSQQQFIEMEGRKIRLLDPKALESLAAGEKVLS